MSTRDSYLFGVSREATNATSAHHDAFCDKCDYLCGKMEFQRETLIRIFGIGTTDARGAASAASASVAAVDPSIESAPRKRMVSVHSRHLTVSIPGRVSSRLEAYTGKASKGAAEHK